MRPDPPAPGTWRRDDGATSFLPAGVKSEVLPTVTLSGGPEVIPPGSTVPDQPVQPAKPVGPEMAPCPYCDKFEYEVVDGRVTQAILDHLESAHPAIWQKMKEEEAIAAGKVEETFT